MRKTSLFGLLLLAAVTAGLLSAGSAADSKQPKPPKITAPSVGAPAAAGGLKPVESDMHEFMEYIYKPTYLRLRTALAKKPRRSDWRKIKADALVQAEGGNLLLIRGPKEDAATWKKMSLENRSLGGKLYAAAKKRDYETAKKHWGAMIKSCNACHTKFAGGEHQLKP